MSGPDRCLPEAEFLREITEEALRWREEHPGRPLPPRWWPFQGGDSGNRGGLMGRLKDAAANGRKSATVFMVTETEDDRLTCGLTAPFAQTPNWLRAVARSGLQAEMIDLPLLLVARRFLGLGYWLTLSLPNGRASQLHADWSAQKPQVAQDQFHVGAELIARAWQLINEGGYVPMETEDERPAALTNARLKLAQLIWPQLEAPEGAELDCCALAMQLSGSGNTVESDQVKGTLSRLVKSGVLEQDEGSVLYRRGNPWVHVYARLDSQGCGVGDVLRIEDLRTCVRAARSDGLGSSSGVSRLNVSSPPASPAGRPPDSPRPLAPMVSKDQWSILQIIWPELDLVEYRKVSRLDLSATLGQPAMSITSKLGGLVDVGVLEKTGERSATRYRRRAVDLVIVANQGPRTKHPVEASLADLLRVPLELPTDNPQSHVPLTDAVQPPPSGETVPAPTHPTPHEPEVVVMPSDASGDADLDRLGQIRSLRANMAPLLADARRRLSNLEAEDNDLVMEAMVIAERVLRRQVAGAV